MEMVEFLNFDDFIYYIYHIVQSEETYVYEDEYCVTCNNIAIMSTVYRIETQLQPEGCLKLICSTQQQCISITFESFHCHPLY